MEMCLLVLLSIVISIIFFLLNDATQLTGCSIILFTLI